MQDSPYVPVLFIPSLLSPSIISMIGVEYEEAVEYLSFFNDLVMEKRKIKHNPDNLDNPAKIFEKFEGNLCLRDLADSKLAALAENLSRSDIPGARGNRAVFVDVNNDIVVVGCTVVYNENWAMLGVNDPTIPTTLLNATG